MISLTRKSRLFIKLGGVLLVLAILVYRIKFMAVPVHGYTLESGPMVAEVMGTGTLEARVKTIISPRIQERLVEVLVDQNDAVKSGQLLARLDDGELRKLVEVAESAHASSKASIDRVKTDESKAQAVLKQAMLEHQRLAGLLSNRVSAEAEFDKAVEQLKVAESDLKRSQAAIAEAELQAISSEKNLLYQKERLGYTQILSPYDGLVVRRDRDPGDVVVPGASILQLISTNEIWVSAWVDESIMADLAPGQPVRVVFRSEPKKNYPGEVVRLGREADRETREFLVDVRVRELPRNWAVGQRAEVFIETSRKTAAVGIPAKFLLWQQGKPGVFINENGRARWRTISIGMHGLDRIEAVDGVSAGTQVIMIDDARKQALQNGQRIVIQ